MSEVLALEKAQPELGHLMLVAQIPRSMTRPGDDRCTNEACASPGGRR